MSRLDDLFARLNALIAELVRSGHADCAEDCAQEALIETWKRLDTIKSGAEWSYLKASAFHKAINRKRRARAKVHGGGKLIPLEEAAEAPEHARSVEEGLVAREEATRFRGAFHAALAELSPETRLCLVLRMRDLGSKEIARSLGLTDQAVRSRLSRAFETIRARVDAPPEGVEWMDLLGNDHDHEG